jgi:hypothetical protein
MPHSIVNSLPKDTAEIETGMTEVQPWDQANRRQKLCLVLGNRKKISQIINACLYLPFFLLIILCKRVSTLVYCIGPSFNSLPGTLERLQLKSQLKEVCNEEQVGWGRWHTLAKDLRPWRSRFVCCFISLLSSFQCIFVSAK